MKEVLRRIIVQFSGGQVEFHAKIEYEDGRLDVVVGQRKSWRAAIKAANEALIMMSGLQMLNKGE